MGRAAMTDRFEPGDMVCFPEPGAASDVALRREPSQLSGFRRPSLGLGTRFAGRPEVFVYLGDRFVEPAPGTSLSEDPQRWVRLLGRDSTVWWWLPTGGMRKL